MADPISTLAQINQQLQQTSQVLAKQVQDNTKNVNQFSSFDKVVEKLDDLYKVAQEDSGNIKNIFNILDEMKKSSESSKQTQVSTTTGNDAVSLSTINETLLSIHKAILQQTAISSAFMAATHGVADLIPDIKSFANFDFTQMLTKFQTIYPQLKKSYSEENKNNEDKQEDKKQEQSGIPNVGEYTNSLKAVLGAFSGLFAGFDKLTETEVIANVDKGMDAIKSMNIGKALESLIKNITENATLKKYIISDNDPNEEQKNKLLQQKIQILGELKGDDSDKERNQKIANIDAQIAAYPEVKKIDPFELPNKMITFLQSFTALGNVSSQTIINLKKISKINVGEYLSKMITSIITNKNLIKLFENDKNESLRQTAYNEYMKLLNDKQNATNDNTKEMIDKKLNLQQQLIDRYSKHSSLGVFDFITAFTNIFSSLNNASQIGFKSILKLNLLSGLNIGGSLAKLINNLSKGLEHSKSEELKQSLEALSSFNTAISGFIENLQKNYFKLKILSKKPLNIIIKNLFKSFSAFDKNSDFGFEENMAEQLLKFKPEMIEQKSENGLTIKDSEGNPILKAKDAPKGVAALYYSIEVQFTMLNAFMDNFIQLKEKSIEILKSTPLILGASLAISMSVKSLVDGFKTAIFSIYEFFNKSESYVNGVKSSFSLKFASVIKGLFAKKNIDSLENKPLENEVKKEEADSKPAKSIEDLIARFMGLLSALTVNVDWKALLITSLTIKAVSISAFKKIGDISHAVIESISKISKIDYEKAKGLILSYRMVTKVLIELALLKKYINDAEKVIDKLTSGKGGYVSDWIKTKANLKKEGLLEKLMSVVEKMIKLETEIVKVNNFDKFTKFVKLLSHIIKQLGTSAIFIPFASISILFIMSVITLMQTIAGMSIVLKLGNQGINEILKGIRWMGFGIILLALATPLIPMAIPAILFVITIMLLFKKLGSPISILSGKSGVQQLKTMANGLLWFFATLAIIALVLPLIGPKIILAMLIVTAMIGMFLLLGLSNHMVKKGARAMLIMSFAILILTLSIAILSLLVAISFKNIILSLIVMFAFVGLFLLLGIREINKEIKEGAIAMLIMSLSMLIFSIALVIMGIALEFWNWKKIAMVTAIIGGLTLATVFLGKMGTDAIMGSVALLLIGVSLVVFSLGMITLAGALALLDWDKITLAGTVFAVLTGAVLGLGVAIATGIGAVAVFGGIAAIGAMGIALLLFGSGLYSIRNVPDWSKERSERFKYLISNIADGFVSLMWPPWKIPALIGGIALSFSLGSALISITTALKSVSEINWDKIPIDKIKKVVVGLGEAFAAVGAENSGGFVGETLKALSFGLLGPDRVKEGIKSVLKSGEALKSISTGIMWFWEMTKSMGDDAFATDSNGKPAEGSLMKKIMLVVGVINKAFSEIGKQKQSNNSLMGYVFGNDFSQTDTEKGINAVKDVGKVLIEITKGLNAFINIDQLIGGKFDDLTNNIKKVMTVVSESFAKIGKDYGGGWFSDGDVKKGIDQVKGIGNILSGVADGLKVFKSLDSAGFKNEDFDPKSDKGVMANIKKVINVIAETFAEIGKKGSWSTDENGRKKWYADESIKRGVESIKGLGSELSNLANGIKIFGSLQIPQDSNGKVTSNGQKIDINLVGENIAKILSVLSNEFAKIGEDQKKKEAVQKGIEAIKGVGTEFKNIAESLKPFMQLQAGIEVNGKIVKINTEQLKKNINEIVSTLLDSIANIAKSNKYKLSDFENVANLLNKADEAIKPITETVKKVVEVSKEVDKTKNAFGENGPIQRMLVDLNKWNLELDKKVNQSGFTTYDKYISYIERYSNAAKGFKEFSGSFKEHVKDMQQMVKAINEIKLDNLKEIINLQKEIQNILKFDKNRVEDVLKALKEYMWSIKDAANAVADGLNKMAESNNNNNNNIKTSDVKTSDVKTSDIKKENTNINSGREIADILIEKLKSSTLNVHISAIDSNVRIKTI